MGVLACFWVRVGGGHLLRRRWFWLVAVAGEGPSRGFADRLAKDASTLECTQMRHCLGNRGAPHETFDAIPRARPPHTFRDAPGRGDAITDRHDDLFEAVLMVHA